MTSDYMRALRNGLGGMWAEFLTAVNSKGDPTTMQPRVADAWNFDLVYDEGLNNSDKTIIVPDGYVWWLLGIFVKLSTSADVGDRRVRIAIRTEYEPVYRLLADARSSTVQAATVTRYYYFAPGLPDLAAFRDTDQMWTPIPANLYLQPGWKIRVYDNVGIALNADDLLVYIHHGQRRA